MLWNKHLEWDDRMDDEDIKVWSTIRLDGSSLSGVQVKRCVAMNGNGYTYDVKYKLVCFCDAS